MHTSHMEVSDIINYVYFGKGVSCHIIHIYSFGGVLVQLPAIDNEEAYWIGGDYTFA